MEATTWQAWGRWLFVVALVVCGGMLCSLDYGTMFWGNWLHSRSFSAGLVLILIGASVSIGVIYRKWRYGMIVLGLLLVSYVAMFWTFPGWMLLHHVISEQLGAAN